MGAADLGPVAGYEDRGSAADNPKTQKYTILLNVHFLLII